MTSRGKGIFQAKREWHGHGKDPNSGKDWEQKKGMTEGEMAEWHHRLDGHGFG